MHKKISILFLCLLSLSSIAASTMKARIHEMDMGVHVNEEVLIFLSSGELLRVGVEQVALLDELNGFKLNQHMVEIFLDDNRRITKLADIEALEPQVEIEEPVESKSSESYIPTVFNSMEEAQAAFELMAKNPHPNSQCYNRAQVWTHEWRKNHGLFTSKGWVFFTRKYVRQHPKFIWWFHVAPMVHVQTAQGIKERMMDRKYMGGPRTIKQWTDFFVKGKPHCPEVDNYSEHALHQDNVDCFVQKSSMYYYNPVDLDELEKTGVEKVSFNSAALREAYHDAFTPRPVVKESETPGEVVPGATTTTTEPIPEVNPETPVVVNEETIFPSVRE